MTSVQPRISIFSTGSQPRGRGGRPYNRAQVERFTPITRRPLERCTLEWAAGIVCAALGALLLVDPFQFYGPAYAVSQPPMVWAGGVLLLSGSALVLTPLWRSVRGVAIVHVLVGAELVLVGIGLAPNRFVASGVSFVLLGLATALVPFLPVSRGPPTPRPIDLFGVVAALTIAACGAIVLVVPRGLDRASGVELGPLEPWYAIGLVGAGLAVLVTELHSSVPRPALWIAYALCGAAFLSYLVLVALPAHMNLSLLYWTGAGLVLPVLPWLGHRLQRVDAASLRTRFALVTGAATALALVAIMTFDTRRDVQALTTETLAHHRRLAASIAEELSEYVFICRSVAGGVPCAQTVDGPAPVDDLTRRISAIRASLGSPEFNVYVLDGQGGVIVPPTAVVSAVLRDDVAQQASGTLRYVAEGGERLAGFAAVEGLDWRVVVEYPALASPAADESEFDYQLTLLIIGLAAVAGALSAGPLVAPLSALAGAAERLAAGGPSVPIPHSPISEVAQLSQAFARLRANLDARTQERVVAEAALRETNRTLAALIHASPVGVICLDLNGAIVEWNPTMERLFNWGRSEVVGRPLAAVFEDTAADSERVAAVLGGANFSGIEMRLRPRTGEYVHVALWNAPIKGADDRVAGFLLIVVNIAERRRFDAERTRRLREEAQRAETETVVRRLTFLAEASGDLSSSLDLEATLHRAASVAVPELADWCTVHLLDASGTVETVARASADASIEDALSELQQRYPPTLEDMSPGAQALRSGQPVLNPVVTAEWLASTALDVEHLRLLERLAPLSVMGVPLIARGRTIGAMTFASMRPGHRHDAASLALAEALARRCALAIENARLHRETRDAVRARETFLSVASHELGGPLARLKAYTDVLLLARSNAGLDDALLERSLGSIQRATDRLAAITQDLFDVARMHAGDFPLRPSRLDFGKLVRDVVHGYADRVGQRHRLVVHVSSGRHMVRVDAQRFEQVLENLLDNAFKYSPDGGEVQASVKSAGGGVLLEVRDQGIGLTAGAVDVMFEPFGRAANAEHHAVPGMGLGLYICRGIVERHGGRVRADSPGEGKGTTVSVWIPRDAG